MRYNILLFLLILSTNLNAQDIGVQKKDSIGSTVEVSLENFWNSLQNSLGRINDYDNLYSDTEESILDKIVTKFEKETSIKIGIVTIDTGKVSKECFDELSSDIAREWGIGKKQKDNVILITICKDYRRISIQTGNEVEKILSDEETEKIIYDYFIQNFKKEKYFEGTLDGLLEIIKSINDKTGK